MPPIPYLPIDTPCFWQYPLWVQPGDTVLGTLPLQEAVRVGVQQADTVSLATIHHDLQTISENGIGYSDAVGQVAFPLIIALFAFAFTFLFSAINDVNRRYDSKLISQMFASSFAYRAFMLLSGISTLYIVAFAALSISDCPALHEALKGYGIGIGVALAGLYAISVLWFVKKCIVYNKPVSLLEEIQQENLEAQRWLPVKLLRLQAAYWIKGLFRGKGYREFHQSAYRLNKSGYEHYLEEIFIDRLADLTCYALDHNDVNLIYAIQTPVDVVLSKEKEATDNSSYRKKSFVEWSASHRLTLRYFNHILSSGNQHWDDQIEETLIFRLLGAFSRSKFMNTADIYWLFKYLQQLSDNGRISLISKYIDRSKYHFTFLSRLSDSAFVRGATPEEAKAVDAISLENWNELRDYHYLVAAYWLSGGNYELLPELIHDKSYRSVYLYPVHPEDILYRYHQCCKRISEDGEYFDRKPVDNLFGKKIDVRAILDSYTVLLLLICSEGDKQPRQGVNKKVLDEIANSKPNLLKYVSIHKSGSEVRRIYPDVNNTDFDVRFADGLNCFMDYYPQTKNSWCPFCKKHDPFAQPLDDTAKTQLEHLLKAALQHRLSFTYGFWGDSYDERNKSLAVGPFMTHVVKDVLVKKMTDYQNDYRSVLGLIEPVDSRLMYLFLMFADAVSPTFREVKNYDLKDYVRHQLKGRESEYVIVDVGHHCYVLLEPHFDDNRQMLFNQKTLYLDIDESRYSQLRDLPLYDKYHQSVLLIRKRDLPKLVKKSITVSYKNISSLDEARYAVELTINPQIELQYSEKAEILCITPVR